MACTGRGLCAVDKSDVKPEGGLALPSVVLSLLLSKTLNVLGLLVVDLGEVSSRILLCA